MSTTSRITRLARPSHLPLLAAAAVLAAPDAGAQTGTLQFSVDRHSHLVGLRASCSGNNTDLIDGGYVLDARMPTGIYELPWACVTMKSDNQLEIPTAVACTTQPCPIEVDAGNAPGASVAAFPGDTVLWYFSVDREAVGYDVPIVESGTVGSTGIDATVFTEGLLGQSEAAADVFAVGPLPDGPQGVGLPERIMRVHDGNGVRGRTDRKASPGIGLHEPCVSLVPPSDPTDAAPPVGDNLDLLSGVAPDAFFFSLDSSFADPLTGLPGLGSAATNGYSGADVLWISPFTAGAQLSLHTTANELGLDLVGGPDSDDIDALIHISDPNAPYDPPLFSYSWIDLGGGDALGANTTDVTFFSVRRGSAVIGEPDSIFGLPIEPGDVLIPPFPNGLSPYPGIWIAAERLGLRTQRTHGAPFGDELDALDRILAVVDQNENSVEDALEIANGLPDCNQNGTIDQFDIMSAGVTYSYDGDGNGVPDECEPTLPATYCTAKLGSLGGTCTPMIDFMGTPSVTSPSPFNVRCVNVTDGYTGALLYGYAPDATPFAGGLRCVALPARPAKIAQAFARLPFANCAGLLSADFNDNIQSGNDPALTPGTTVYCQWVLRDCPNTFTTGLSDALSVPIRN